MNYTSILLCIELLQLFLAIRVPQSSMLVVIDSLMRDGKLHGGPSQLLFVLQQSSTLKADIRRGCIRRPP